MPKAFIVSGTRRDYNNKGQNINQRVTKPSRLCRVHLENEVGYEISVPIHDYFARRRSLACVGCIDFCAERGVGFHNNSRGETHAGG
jgi:hypothetical protein